ncbi:MAK10-like protein [Tanacetum coccineum]
MEAHLAPTQHTQVNKITTSCEICSGPHDTQYCMEDPEQSFVEYASLRTNEAGGKWYTFKPEQNNLGGTYNPSWETHPNLRPSLIDCQDHSLATRLRETEYFSSFVCSFLPNNRSPMLITPSTSINAIKTCSMEANISQTSQLQTGMGIGTQQPEEPEPTLEDEFQDLHLNLPALEVLAHTPIYNAMLDKYMESLELGKSGSAFVQGEVSAKKEDPGYSLYPLNIGLLEETKHIFGLADRTKSYPVGIVKDVEVYIGKLKLLNDFYVIDMKKDPETPLLVGRGFLATTNAVIDCRMAKIAVGEGITRESYKPRPSSDGVGAQIPYYTRKDFLDCHLPGEWEIARDAEINPFKDLLVFRRMVEFLGGLPKLKCKHVGNGDLFNSPIN